MYEKFNKISYTVGRNVKNTKRKLLFLIVRAPLRFYDGFQRPRKPPPPRRWIICLPTNVKQTKKKKPSRIAVLSCVLSFRRNKKNNKYRANRITVTWSSFRTAEFNCYRPRLWRAMQVGVVANKKITYFLLERIREHTIKRLMRTRAGRLNYCYTVYTIGEFFFWFFFDTSNHGHTTRRSNYRRTLPHIIL